MLSAPTPGCATLAGGTSMALPHSIPAARTNGIATHSAWMKPVPSSSRRRWAGSNTGALFLTPKRPKRLLKRSSTTFADLGLRSLKRISRYFAKKEEALCLLFLLVPLALLGLTREGNDRRGWRAILAGRRHRQRVVAHHCRRVLHFEEDFGRRSSEDVIGCTCRDRSW